MYNRTTTKHWVPPHAEALVVASRKNLSTS
jgi:hypothetical protein